MSKKILMALMGLEIGGAETHVVELSKELHRRGYEVVVVSNGGVYERELVEAGIRCHRAPLHKRSLGAMFRSLVVLRRIIREEKPDVVHAHARIPAFLCGILHRFMRFPFVTSAHWVFYVNGLLKKITDWGERTVAVSDDIREYLKENYGVPHEHIRVTINGIDTKKFSPEVSGERVLREFGFSAERPTISYVSRMDESRALVARHLVEIAPQLRAAIPGVQILIAGGGDVFDEIKAKADAANAAAGENYIVMTGARTDINEIVAAGDVFVGVSRAALEAMAAEKVTIVAGNEGYIGLFGREKLTLAQESNFCCRGCEAAAPELLSKDLLFALQELDETQRAELGRYGREVIETYYSVARMAADCEASYREVWAEHTRVVVSGYYGYDNLGDDAILLSLRESIRTALPGATVVALSNKPAETRERCGIEAVYRFNPFALRRELRRCTLFLSGGGSLLQDHTSTRSLVYYTTLIRMAHSYGKKVMLYANGIGPVRETKNRERVREVCGYADVITLRDAVSAEELRSMGVAEEKIHVTADPVYAMSTASRERGEDLLRAAGLDTARPVIGVSVRFARGMETNVAEFAAFCDRIAEQAQVVFIVMQTPADTAAGEAVCAKMHAPAHFITAPYDPQGMAAMIGCMEAVVSTRLHSIIFAAREHTPVLGVVYDPKVSACLAELGMEEAGTLDGFDAEKAYEKLQVVLDKREHYVAKLEENVIRLAEKARENEAALGRLLEE
ncbi:MAG: polysaccharide pyruvyl transferase CsaB [Oscillospiraceae bacterium]|nr:polysaccharide pyruvyl transferase CsaB [Oscillospiraceae bacterium]